MGDDTIQRKMWGMRRKNLREKRSVPEKSILHQILFLLETLWLFNRSDLVSIVFPEVNFGIFSALSGSLLTTNSNPNFLSICLRTPQVFLCVWLNLLVTTVANQRLPDSAAEDLINKPWRPVPSGRITSLQARHILLYVLPVAFGASAIFGGMRPTALLMIFTWIYNDLGAADEDWIVRNLLNAFGFSCFGAAATEVAAGGDGSLNSQSLLWFVIIGLVIFSTIHVQDMYDQEGDAKRGRLTAPLVMGDTNARLSIMFPVVAWSLLAPAYWNAMYWGYVAPLFLALVICIRTFCWRTVAADRLTFKFWCIWTVSLYTLPFSKSIEGWWFS